MTERDVAQPGSAPEWGSGGPGFKSRGPDWSNAKHRWRLRRRCFVLQEAVVPFVVLFCQPPDPHQGVAATASTGCECGIAHLLRLAHHCQQRVCIGLLIAGEQRLGLLPAARRGDVLEGVMLSLRRPLRRYGCHSPPSSFGSLAFLSAITDSGSAA